MSGEVGKGSVPSPGATACKAMHEREVPNPMFSLDDWREWTAPQGFHRVEARIYPEESPLKSHILYSKFLPILHSTPSVYPCEFSYKKIFKYLPVTPFNLPCAPPPTLNSEDIHVKMKLRGQLVALGSPRPLCWYTGGVCHPGI